MKICYENEFYKDMEDIKHYISQYSFSIKKQLIQKILEYIEYLSLFPEMGRLIIPEYNIRKLVYQKYIILYQIDYYLNHINILTIFHSKRDINFILKHIQKFL